MSGLFVGERLAITLGIFTIAGNYWAMMLENNNSLLFTETQLSLPTYWLIQSGYLLLALGLMWLFGRSMRANLEEVRASEQTLIDRMADLRQANSQLEMSQQTLRRREGILEALRFASERLFRGRSFEDSVQATLRDLGRATGVDRVYLFENHTAANDRLLTSQRYEWVADGVNPEIDNPDLQNLDFAEVGFSRWAEVLSRNDVLKDHVREMPESERAILEPQGILSLIIVPIFIGERWWGFIGFDETKWEREWSPAEEDALRGAGGILGGAIERNETEQRLNQSEARYLGILQDQFDLICRYTPDGQLLFANDAYIRFYGIKRSDLAKYTIWEQILPDRVEGLKAKIASLKVEDPVAVSESLSPRADGEKRWIEWTERGIFNQRGELIEIQAVGRDINDEVRLRKQLEESLIKTESLAMTDGLTGLLNRRAITERAEAEWQRAQRENRALSLMIIDLDRLKEINDTHGHAMGDAALKTVSDLMRSSMRRYDWVGRWGGDEFLLILPGTPVRDAGEVAERLRQRVKQTRLPVEHDSEVYLQLSIGVAGYDQAKDRGSLAELLQRADEELYKAKQAGRDRVSIAEQ
jgi:diguanylate cyclase (GGDEF)-like protein/PAS domain S-box-containing protein